MRVERTHSEHVVGRNEDDGRHALRTKRPKHAKPIDLGHLHVEKNELRIERAQRAKSLATVPRFADDRVTEAAMEDRKREGYF